MRTACAILALLAGGVAYGASFDCTKAKTPQEKAICGSRELSLADEKLNAAYKTVQSSVPAEFAIKVRDDQRNWLQLLPSQCRDTESVPSERLTQCMLRMYAERTADLQSRLFTAGGVRFFSRSIKLTWADSNGTSPEWEETPGFGTLKAMWPQSTRETAEWRAWNKAIEAATQSLASVGGDSSPTGEWLKKWAADVDGEVTASVGLVSEELVTASIGSDVMGHGAGHPGGSSIELNWLLKQKRELRPDDVFRRDSDWEKAIETLCSEDLQRPDANLFDDWKQALPKVVLDSENWELNKAGLTINFPEYSVSPHVSPVSPVLIPWTALKPFLQSGFAIPK
jgi:uncharacterized protein YecT (DUF1311 family)